MNIELHTFGNRRFSCVRVSCFCFVFSQPVSRAFHGLSEPRLNTQLSQLQQRTDRFRWRNEGHLRILGVGVDRLDHRARRARSVYVFQDRERSAKSSFWTNLHACGCMYCTCTTHMGLCCARVCDLLSCPHQNVLSEDPDATLWRRLHKGNSSAGGLSSCTIDGKTDPDRGSSCCTCSLFSVDQ